MTGSTHDAIVIGAGPNGLVAANHLASNGWSVLVLEAQPEPGGAVRSDRELHPGFVQDTFSAFYPLGAASQALQSLELEQHGLRWEHAPAVLGHPLPGGDWAVLHRDRDVTARGLEALHPGDGAAWLDLCANWDRYGAALAAGLTSPFPPVSAGARLLPGIVRSGGLDLVRRLLTPAASLGRHLFGGSAPGLLIAGNAGHADMPLASPGSGAFGLLMTMLGQTVGFPAPRGGAGQLTAALVSRLTSLGGRVETGVPVTRIVVDRGRAVAVETGHGQRYAVGRAIIADVAAPRLFGGLVAPDDVPARIARGMRVFELDPSTVKVDWALSGPVPWDSQPAYAPGTFHIADSIGQLTEALDQVGAGMVPDKPFLLAGQMTTTDATRSPAGTESMWAYTHVPQRHAMRGDLGGGITGRWDHDDLQRFADRMQARIEAYAPELASRIIARRVLGPHELEARNANLIGGAINAGTSQLHQDVVFRPVPAMWGRPETGIGGLYLGSASAHPGGGVHGAPGHNAARAAVWHDRARFGRRRRQDSEPAA